MTISGYSIFIVVQNESEHLGGYNRSINPHYIIILSVSASSQLYAPKP